jgi:Family of unknown function (DUF6384)
MSSNPVPYDTMLAALDAVDVAQRRKSANDSTLSVSEKREALLKEIGAFYERQGLTVDSKIIEQGVDEFLSSELEFLPPKDPLLSVWATLWVRRKIVLISTAAVMGMLGIGLGVNYSASTTQKDELRRIATGIESNQSTLQAAVESVNALAGPVQTSGHPRSVDWATAKVEFLQAAELWQKEVTATTSQIQKEEPRSLPDFETAERGQEITTFRASQDKLTSEMNALQNKAEELKTEARFYIQYPVLLAELNAAKPDPSWPVPLANSFMQSTEEARQALDAGNQAAFHRALAQRSDVLKNGRQLQSLTRELDSLKATLDQKITDPEALQHARDLAEKASGEIVGGGLDSARNTMEQLRSYIDFVRSAFVLRIVSRSGVKSGIDRYYTDSAGRRVAGYYVIVEAVDAGGRSIKQPIRNEENGSVQQVSIWGERVPKAVYEKIKADKLDNGRIDNDIVGTKKAGTAKVDYTMIPTSEGRITRW